MCFRCQAYGRRLLLFTSRAFWYGFEEAKQKGKKLYKMEWNDQLIYLQYFHRFYCTASCARLKFHFVRQHFFSLFGSSCLSLAHSFCSFLVKLLSSWLVIRLKWFFSSLFFFYLKMPTCGFLHLQIFHDRTNSFVSTCALAHTHRHKDTAKTKRDKRNNSQNIIIMCTTYREGVFIWNSGNRTLLTMNFKMGMNTRASASANRQSERNCMTKMAKQSYSERNSKRW